MCRPAPAGHYVDSEGAAKAVVYTAGGYCPEGSVAPTDCPAGYYCEEGAAVPAPCPAGTYSDLVVLVEMDQCVQCPAGKYCQQSEKT